MGVSLSRDLTFLNSSTSILAVCADDVTVACEHLHASLLNVVARVWREAGLPVGDVVPPYVYSAYRCAVADVPWTANDNPGASLGGGSVHALSGLGNPLAGASGESLSSRLFGMMLTHEQVGCTHHFQVPTTSKCPPPPSALPSPPLPSPVIHVSLFVVYTHGI